MASGQNLSMSAANTHQGKARVLHLIGSRQDEFYHDLSVLYARACDGCNDLNRERFDFLFAIVNLDGSMSFPSSLEETDLASAKRMTIAAGIMHISELSPDVMVPHMFCVEGMTRFRSLFDLLEIPFLGNHEYTVWPATDKATTKQLLSSNNVQVPKGELCEKGLHEIPVTVKVPLVVKPCNEDNSRGITLVKKDENLAAAMEYAFSFDSRVVVDEYIAGREVRAAVIEEEDGSLTVLPKIEYFLEDIRTSAHKLQTGSNGKLSTNAIVAAKKDGDRKCPADLSLKLHQRIDDMVKRAHKVLNCHHYSLYDIRISADEEPYILEAALFCSFSPLSVIPAMAQHAGREDLKHPRLFENFLERAIKERKQSRQLKEGQSGSFERKTSQASTDTHGSSEGGVSESSSGQKSSIAGATTPKYGSSDGGVGESSSGQKSSLAGATTCK